MRDVVRWVLLATLLQGGIAGLCGCGRIGYDLLPRLEERDAAPSAEDADVPDAGGSDGAVDGGGQDAETDASADGAIEDAAPVDGHVVAPDAGDGQVEDAGNDAGRLADDDVTCNGIDDDADGEADEDYPSSETVCGTGACRAVGVTHCVDGAVVDDCSPGTPAADDASCDGVDDDCDGEVDEDYAPVATVCGVGACQRAGVTSCPSGAVVDDCTVGAPASGDATCDGVDDDCDGLVDEDYASTSTSCGAGVCAGQGALICQSGIEVDSCSGGAGGSVDASCNGDDDDCDGSTDEDYQSVVTTCGVGACRRSGMSVCEPGGVVESGCTPGTPSADDNTGVPGVDDDCDGEVDEDVVCSEPDRTYGAGAHSAIAIPPECTRITVRLWGGGGAAGERDLIEQAGGPGGAGGYAQATFDVTTASVLDVFVGQGGHGCTGPGQNDGAPSLYSGGAGGSSGVGQPGEGSEVGGEGGTSSGGRAGGLGRYGGGGGGTGIGAFGVTERGGGGGAASVARLGGAVRALAGGGGGGGGSEYGPAGEDGRAGGAGCTGSGASTSGGGGGGGGAGRCAGANTANGNGRIPANDSSLPSGRAQGGQSSCGAGGDGYAIVSFSRP